MVHDQTVVFYDEEGVELKHVIVCLNLDKKIFLICIIEEDDLFKKKYIRGLLILMGNQLLTSIFCDTMHFMEELNLFDFGNSQNKFLDITEYKSTKNLKLKHNGNENIFISKSEAKSIYRLFNLIFLGNSVTKLLEKEIKLTPQQLTLILDDLGFL
jgi:hypothetical protein